MKSRFVLSLVLVMAVLLTACAPAATPTAAPALPRPPRPPLPRLLHLPRPPLPRPPRRCCPPAAGGTLKIAILAPLSGAVPTFGVSTRDGALLAIEEWNAKGGVLGKKIEAVVADSQCSADPAVNAANKVIDQDKVHYIIGEVCSSASIPISEIANEKNVVQISPTSTNPQVTLNADGTHQAVHLPRLLHRPLPGHGGGQVRPGQPEGYKTAFIMFDQGNDYVRGLAEAFEEAFTEGGGTDRRQGNLHRQTTPTSPPFWRRSPTAKPDVLYLPDYYNIVNLVGAQAKEKGITVRMMGGDGWDSADLDVKAADGGFYTNHYDPGDTRPIVQDLVEELRRQVQ